MAMDDVLKQAINEFAGTSSEAGQDDMSQVSEESEVEDNSESSDFEAESIDTGSDWLSDNEETGAASEDALVEDSSNNDIEELFVTDEKGRRSVKVDFSDRDSIKQLIAKSYGMRKFQKERDEAKRVADESRQKLTELQKFQEELQTAVDRDGIKGLVNLVLGQEDAYESHLQQQLERAKARDKASPEQLKQIEALERAEEMERKSEYMAKQLEQRQQREAQLQQEQETQSLQQMLNRPYAKHSFTGKLGDAELEDTYNEALWNLATSKLKQLPEDTELTDSLVEKTFKQVASTFNKAVTKQVKERTAKTTQRKKDSASVRVQQRARAGLPKSESASERFKKNIRSQNWGDALAAVMEGRVKLK